MSEFNIPVTLKRKTFYVAIFFYVLSILNIIFNYFYLNIKIIDYVISPLLWIFLFLIWFVTVVDMQDNRPKKESDHINDYVFDIHNIFKKRPTWLTALVIFTILYSMISFVVLTIGVGNASIIEGQYVITDHGKFIKNITEEEYSKHIKLENIRTTIMPLKVKTIC